MPGKAPLFINGKFMSGGPAAVHRVAQELIAAVWNLAEDRQLHLLVPPWLSRLNNDPGVPATPVGRLGSGGATVLGRVGRIAWEQISLPRAARGGVLLNLCNMTPLVTRNGLTMVHDAQGFTAPESYPFANRMWGLLHQRTAGARQLGLLTVSEFARSELAGFGVAPAERIHVVHNGVDHVLRAPAQDTVLARLNLAPGGYALSLANLQPHKNIAMLIRAFARTGLAGLKLVLAGKGTREDFAAAGAVATENVVFAGYVSDGEMRSLQTHALAVCTPSLTEGFGLPPVEGLLLGTPAVIAPCGALPEVCGPGALQADPRDPAAWEAALLRLRDEPGLREELSRKGKDFAARFTWDAAARRLLEVVDTVAPR
ncbi:MAG: putative glycosyl transferase group 1 [Microvirga sp.]|jgi:glycosyltransferase involved in cell wall biosynthesis|nr:putative glycosyl transferase group 1 [Microvirga sp.]